MSSSSSETWDAQAQKRSMDTTCRPRCSAAYCLAHLKQDAEPNSAHPPSGDHRAGVLRRSPPQGDAGRRPHRRPGSARHHQRADRRGHRLRLPAGLLDRGRQLAARMPRRTCWSTTWAAARSTSPCGDRGRPISRAGHRRRRQLGGSDWDQRWSITWPSSSCQQRDRPARTRAPAGCGGCEPRGQARSRHAAKATWPAATAASRRGIEVTRQTVRASSPGTCSTAPDATTAALVGQAGLTWSDIDRVLLVGGSSRMPMVAQMLRRLSGKEPDRSHRPTRPWPTARPCTPAC